MVTLSPFTESQRGLKGVSIPQHVNRDRFTRHILQQLTDQRMAVINHLTIDSHNHIAGT